MALDVGVCAAQVGQMKVDTWASFQAEPKLQVAGQREVPIQRDVQAFSRVMWRVAHTSQGGRQRARCTLGGARTFSRGTGRRATRPGRTGSVCSAIKHNETAKNGRLNLGLVNLRGRDLEQVSVEYYEVG